MWVTEADVLGTVGDGWKVVQEVLAFERVGIARYARCERLLACSPLRCSATGGTTLPDELRGRWARMLTHCRRARLLAYRVVASKQRDGSRPGDAAAYRIAVTRLDQDSAEVLMEHRRPAHPPRARPRAASVERSRTTGATPRPPPSSSGSIEMQRILLARAMLAAT